MASSATNLIEATNLGSSPRPVDRRPLSTMLATTVLSTFGNQLTSLAIPWFVLETTGSASKTGIVAAVTLIPMVVSAFFGGTIADRVQQKTLSIGADVLSGLTVAAVPLLYLTVGLSFPMLLALTFLGAIFDGPGSTARSAMTPALAERGGLSLESVNSKLGIVSAGTSLLGAPLAGALIAFIGAVNVLWINAATFALSAVLMLLFIPRAADRDSSATSFIEDLRIGLRFVLAQPTMRAIVVTAVIMNLVFSPLMGVAVPYLAKTEYDSSTQLGFMAGAIGLGALIGSVLFGMIGSRIGRYRQLMIDVVLIAFPLWILVTIPTIWLSAIALLIAGIGTGLVNPMLITMLQQGTPSHLLGRAVGTLSALSMVAAPLGMLAGGSLIAAIGLTGGFATIAGVATLIVIAVTVLPAYRGIDTLSTDLASSAADA
jgi:MFS family permease